MSNLVNIPTTVKDVHYRYQMERMICKVEGKGNGIKTVVTNIANVARDLRVPPSYPTKYFGIHFGALSNYDAKDERGIVNGKIEAKDMEAALNVFIRKYLLCRKCDKPEADLSVDKHQNVVLMCKSCGHLSVVDPMERLNKFIIAHPPEHTATKSELKAMQTTQQVLDASAAIDEDHDEDWSADVTEDAVRRRHEEESTGMNSNMLGLSLQDVTELPKKKKKKKKPSKKETNGAEEQQEEEDGGEISPVDVLKSFLQVKPDATDAQLQKAIKKIQTDYELGNLDAVCLMFEAFFDKDILKQVPRFAPVMETYAEGTKAQKIILNYIEDFVGKAHKSLLTSLPLILEKFYDCDLLEEDVIIEWYGKKKSKFIKSSKTLTKIKEAAKPFVHWLQTADSD